MERTDAIKLLAIDDKPDNLTTLSAVVRDVLPQTRVLTATNGPAGIELAAAEDPDVILLDIVMPGMDGFEVCRRLKADERIRDIPVVFLTALKTDTASRVKALEVGGEGFLAKPLETAELTAQIRAMTKVKAANRSRRTEQERLEALVAERTVDLRESESRYHAMFENMASASCVNEIVYKDGRAVDYRILDVNPAYERITGIRRQEAVGALASALYGLGEAPFLDVYGRVAETGEPAEFEAWLESLQKHLHVTVGCPKPGFFSTVFTDITERKRTEEELRNAERHLRSTLDGLSAHIAVIDEYGEIILTNKSYHDFAEQNGIEPRAVSEGTNYLAVCDTASGEHSEEAKPFAEGIREVLSGKRQSFELEYPCHSPDEKRWFIGRVTPIQGAEHRRVVVTHENITERRNAENVLRESEERFSTAFQTAPYAVTITRAGDGKFIEVNDAFTTISGFTRQEADAESSIGLRLWVNSEDRDRVVNDLRAGQMVDGHEYQFRRKGNDTFVGLFSARLILVGGEYCILSSIMDITERKRAEAQRQEGFDLLDNLARLVPGVIYQYRLYPDGRSAFPYASPGMYDIYEVTPEEVREDAAVVFGRLHPEDHDRVAEAIFASARTLNTFQCEFRVILPRQGLRWRWSQAHPERTEDGGTLWHGTILDITERKLAEEQRRELEDQLRQQQRLETVGQLAAGVAHDFNNLLTGITGYTLFAHDSLPAGSAIREDLTEVLALAHRAAELTHQLLAFSRRQPLQPVVLNINEVIAESAKMLHRLLGEHLHLELTLAPQVGMIKVDPGQFEQVLINLAVNARDAMQDGGKLTIETANVVLDEAYATSHAGTHPGAYVMLAVTDTGQGIDEAIIAKIFEPFFTTKAVGQGTGLGLATVYGIVKQHGGNIWVYSEVGHGTTFKVYLPRASEDGDRPGATPPAAVPAGNATILVVEDSDAVRQVAQRYLEAAGYRVLIAALPSEAIALLQEHGETITVMLTDVVMPEQSGHQLYESVRPRFPHLRVLYMSGYPVNAIVHDGVLDAGTPFIEKPFTMESLTHKVRELLTGGADVD
jgi:two-component system cell cycle sensor histidine kinase/response regulator CckA